MNIKMMRYFLDRNTTNDALLVQINCGNKLID